MAWPAGLSLGPCEGLSLPLWLWQCDCLAVGLTAQAAETAQGRAAGGSPMPLLLPGLLQHLAVTPAASESPQNESLPWLSELLGGLPVGRPQLWPGEWQWTRMAPWAAAEVLACHVDLTAASKLRGAWAGHLLAAAGFSAAALVGAVGAGV